MADKNSLATSFIPKSRDEALFYIAHELYHLLYDADVVSNKRIWDQIRNLLDMIERS